MPSNPINASVHQIEKPKGLKRIALASLNSVRGIRWLAQHEAAFRQEAVLCVFLTAISFALPVSMVEHGALILALLFVMLIEVVNTAIEVVVDRIGLERHPLSGLAKDLGSAAVTLAICMATLTWFVILYSAMR